MYRNLFLLLWLTAACNHADLQQTNSRTDASMRSIDSSARINEHSRLPRDSPAAGVQH